MLKSAEERQEEKKKERISEATDKLVKYYFFMGMLNGFFMILFLSTDNLLISGFFLIFALYNFLINLKSHRIAEIMVEQELRLSKN